MNHRGGLPATAVRARRPALAVVLLGLCLGALGFAAAVLRSGAEPARADDGPGAREVVMHFAFPDTRETGVLTVSLFLVDDGSDLSDRIAEGRAAMLARFPGAVELSDADVQAQFNISDNVRWPGPGTEWSYNPAGATPLMSADAALAAITAGANGWTNAGGSGWKYTYAGKSATAAGCNGAPGVVPRDSQNIVGWGHIVNDSWGYTCWWRGFEKLEGTSFFALQEFDIIFESGLRVPYTANVLRALALHEFGHGLGLGHTEGTLCPGRVMCAGSGATTQQAVTPDDVAGVVALYGVAPTPAPTTAPPPTATPTPPLFPNGAKERRFVPGVARD